MVRSLVPLTLAFGLIAATVMAGCLEGVVIDPNCAPTAVAGDWQQQDLWQSFPEDGVHGPYNITRILPTGTPLDDPQWGEVVLTHVERREHDEASNSTIHYRLDHEGRLNVNVTSATGTIEQDEIEDAVVLFLRQTTKQEETELRPIIHRLLERNPPEAGTGITLEAPEEDEHHEYTLDVEGPLRLLDLYEELLAESGDEERPDPWQDGQVRFDDWSFHFPVPHAVASNTEQTGRYLSVDARDRAHFQWDPPKGIGSEALYAGIERTLRDLGLEAPPKSDIQIQTVTC
jgi:hypothetical protein